MNKDKRELLSAVFDGEDLPDDELFSLLKNDSELQSRWQRYQITRSAMRGEMPETLVADMCTRVSAAIAKEDVVVFAPPKRRRSVNARALGKQAAGMAIAATIATVAVLNVQTTGRVDNVVEPQQIALVPAATPVVASVVAQDLRTVNSPMSTGVQTRLNGYIVNHNEFSSRAGMQGIPAYTRIVATTPGEFVANDQ